MDAQAAASCESCRFWRARAGGSDGECRRHAALPFVLGAGAQAPGAWWARWPLTLPGDWCGEWQPPPHGAGGGDV